MDHKNLVKIFKIIGNEQRFLILKNLHNKKELCVGDLAEAINFSFRATSKDLAILRNAELVQFRNFDFKKRYSINYSKLPKEFLVFLEN